MYYVYVSQSQKNKQFYIGRTADIRRRWSEHKRGKVRTTNRLNPMRLIFFEAFASKKDSIRRERYLKTSKGKSSLRQILRESLK